MLDKAFGVPMKARNADVYVFTLSRFEEFPQSVDVERRVHRHEEGQRREPAADAAITGDARS